MGFTLANTAALIIAKAGPLGIKAGGRGLIVGLALGVVLGFLIQKARLAKFCVIVDAFRLKDFTMAKVMFTAIIIASLGLFYLEERGYVEFHVKDMKLGAISIGAALFGIGMVVYGYCPGTAAAAVGEGRLDALAGVFGALAGGALFAEVYPHLTANVLSWGTRGKETLPGLFPAIDKWIVIGVVDGVLLILAVVVLPLVERGQGKGLEVEG